MHVCRCMFVCTHTNLQVCVCILTCMHAKFACVCVDGYIYVGLAYRSVHVYLHTLIVTYMHAEYACVCVHVYMYTH